MSHEVKHLSRYLVYEVEGLCGLGELDAGELSAEGFLDWLMIELHGLQLLREVGIASLDMNGITDCQLSEIQLDRGDGVLSKNLMTEPMRSSILKVIIV